MMSHINSIWKFLSYWYFRYLLVTELYMVEKWERAFFNVILIVFLSMLSYMNCALLHYISQVIYVTGSSEK